MFRQKLFGNPYLVPEHCDPCASVSRVSRVLEIKQTHIHIHAHTFTPWRVPRGGGLEGRHAHGELEAQV